MNAEELLIHIKEFVEGLDDIDDIHIIPSKGDPTKQQDRVSFIVMNKMKNGIIPKFMIHVEDLEALRKM
jgi:hypothetical protein